MSPHRPLTLAAFLLALAAPTLTHAQMGGMGGTRGGMGGMGGRPGGMGGRGGPGGMGPRRAPEYVKAKELEKYNIAALLLDDARKLRLSDEQKSQLTALEATIAQRNAPLIARYDSLHQNFKAPSREDFRRRRPDDDQPPRDDPAADSARVKAFMMAEAIDQLITRREQDASEAMAFLFAEDARARALQRIAEQTQEMNERLPHLRPRNGGNPDFDGERRRRP